jgi:hypothetical protein
MGSNSLTAVLAGAPIVVIGRRLRLVVLRLVVGGLRLTRALPRRPARLGIGMKRVAENQLVFSFPCPAVFLPKCHS